MENNLRIIKTARSEAAINAAVKEGYWPLVKPVVPSPQIKSKYSVVQNTTTGEIKVVHDYRENTWGDKNLATVIDFTYYYPHHFESPFAAYLIPSDIVIGETVWLSDLIEDIVSGNWNQGDTFRLKSCEATWNGKDFIIHVKPLLKDIIVG
ncbi:MAG: hypothetical protein WC615_04890 [Mucilaginibacter sp.]|jgi:hypothetical protein|uniref:hypothetical protein n=1 Tax=Mucilaginibacter sp. TaxID=1882438 RepID=UPI00356B56B0